MQTEPAPSATRTRWPAWIVWPLAVVLAALGVAALAGLYGAVVWLRLPAVAAADLAAEETAYMQAAREGGRCSAFNRTPIAAEADRVSPALACAVVWAEDRRFFWHDGFDGTAFADALRADLAAGDAHLGGSTIAMQLARNLYLSAARTPTRKLKEIVLARRLVDHVGHDGVLAAYLDAAEWAPCVYGAEAAAQHHFGHPAAELTPAEATFLAAMLPRPGRPPGATEADRDALMRRQQILLGLLFRARLLDRPGLEAARREVIAMWAGGKPHHVDHGDHEVVPDAVTRRCGSNAQGLLPRLKDIP
jgi:membrane peptidoglycan carboxypeptidase